MKLVFRLLLLLWLTLAACAQPKLSIPPSSEQLVLILSSGWDDATAEMYRFERDEADQAWRRVGKRVAVNLGRTGLAWGRSELIGQVDSPGTRGPRKREGDGKSPAGLFPFLKAFGHPKAPAGYREANLPFLVITDEQCVDDGKSEYYNRVVDPDQVGGVSWTSAETMKIDLYRMGLVVGHNCPKPAPGLGSCIFFHRQRGPGDPTSGCTSMDDPSLTELLLWLEKEAAPVVLQLPEPVFESLHDPRL